MTDQTGLRATLVTAGRAELAEKGRAAVSLRAVARRAEVSHAAPGYHFGDRAGLLTAIATDGFDELARVMDVPVDHGDIPPLAVLGMRYVEFAARNPALYDLMFRPEELDLDDEALRRAMRASLTALTGATSDSGATGGPTELTALSWALAHGVASLSRQGALATLPLDTGASPDPAALFERYARAIRPS